MRKVLVFLVAALCAPLLTVISAGAALADGECAIETWETLGSPRAEIRLFNVFPEAEKVSYRRDGRWVSTLDDVPAAYVPTTQASLNSELTSSWVARVTFADGHTADLPCPVREAGSLNRTFCSSTWSYKAADVKLAFPSLDARQVVVRRDGKWLVTLNADADRWTDPDPVNGGEYVIRVRGNDGSRFEIPCPKSKIPFALTQTNADGTIDRPRVLPEPIFAEPAFVFDGPQQTKMSADGSTAVRVLRSAETNWLTELVRIDTASGEARLINTALDNTLVEMSENGSVIAYFRRGKLRVWRLDESRAAGFVDRSYDIGLPLSPRLAVTNDGSKVFFASNEGVATIGMRVLEVATGEIRLIERNPFSWAISSDGSRVYSSAVRSVIDVATENEISIPEPTWDNFYSTYGLTGDGSSVIVRNSTWECKCVGIANIDTREIDYYAVQQPMTSVYVRDLSEDASQVVVGFARLGVYIQDLAENTITATPNDVAPDTDFVIRRTADGDTAVYDVR